MISIKTFGKAIKVITKKRSFRNICVIFFITFIIFLYQKGTFDTFLRHTELYEYLPWWAQSEIFPDRNDTVAYYAYGMLTYDQQQLYDDMFTCISHHSSLLRTRSTSKNTIQRVYEAVISDHAEIYWVDGFIIREHDLGRSAQYFDFVPQYTMSKREAISYASDLRNTVSTLLQDAPRSGSDYEKSKWVYEYLAQNMVYDRDAKYNQNLLSSLLYKKSVCRGYAAAAQYLLRELGIESVIISGTWNGTPHAWNMSKLDGYFYHMDTTLSQSELSVGNDQIQLIDYSYLNMTTEELLREHSITASFPLPSCTHQEDNFYFSEHTYLATYDTSRIDHMIRTAYTSHRPYLSLKCSSYELFRRYEQYVRSHADEILQGEGNILYYSSTPALYCLTIYFP